MEFVYLLLGGCEWEDMTIVLNLDDAINLSKKYPKLSVAIFKKDTNGYVPSYCYYRNGEYVDES
jgi:hypothetical protein